MALEPLLIARPTPGLEPDAGVDGVLLPALANRHGLIAGATGTGKTVTLQRLVEQCSRIGVPTLLADVKGDLSGLAAPGQENPGFSQRREQLGLPSASFRFRAPCGRSFTAAHSCSSPHVSRDSARKGSTSCPKPFCAVRKRHERKL